MLAWRNAPFSEQSASTGMQNAAARRKDESIGCGEMA